MELGGQFDRFFQDEEGNSNKGIIEIIISKNKVGSLGNCKLKFDNRNSIISENIDDFEKSDIIQNFTFESKMKENFDNEAPF